jgi:UDPglucose 6-dehydrogenase
LKAISVFGLGRVGLVTAVCLAKKGYNVTGIDPNTRLLDVVRRAEPPYHEPHLREYLKDVVGRGLLRVGSDPASNSSSRLTFITVGTPSFRDGSLDLSFIRNAAKSIARSLPGNGLSQLVVIKSTVTPGTARSVVKPILRKNSGKGKHFRLCSNPEFLREGKAIHDTRFPDRLVIGSDDPKAIEELAAFYTGFYAQSPPPIIRTSHENAELIKCANNAFLAAKISLINSFANIAERLPGGDVQSVAEGIGLDSRIGRGHLNAGLGWGGSCFPKDLPALIHFSRKVHYDPELLSAAWRVNLKQWRVAIQMAEEALGPLRGKNVAVLGLAFKPDTDDMRKAVSIPLVRTLIRKGAKVRAYDPAATDNAKRMLGEAIQYERTSLQCLNEADCCIVVTEWDEFKNIAPSTFLERMRRPVVIDGRRIYNSKEFVDAGIRFHAVGLGPL